MDNFTYLEEHGTVRVEGFNIGAGGNNLEGVMVKEMTLSESLLTQSPHTSVILHSTIYKPPGKNFDSWKNKDMTFYLIDGFGGKLSVNQKVYRLEERHFTPTNVGQTEEMTVRAVDQTLLKDAQCLVSKSWKCTKPNEIVNHVLGQCVSAQSKDVHSADPARDYIAENLHPYQIIAQQANVALDGDDPSFLHFMTYENNGKHYFRSLKDMASGSSVMTYKQADIDESSDHRTKPDTGYYQEDYAINFTFPCDFDYLSDLLNGVDENGQDQNSMGTTDQVFKLFSKMISGGGSQSCDCGIGQFNYKEAMSNKATAEQRNSCNLDVEKHLLKRQARMGLLERDKIALRITVPCNLNLHAGQVITLKWENKKEGGPQVYGSGDYLISSMMHHIKLGGLSVTVMDCVSKTVSQGVV